METEKDKELWKLAKRRVGFKRHLATYAAVNTFFWVIWLVSEPSEESTEMPWPVWPMLGWGIGLMFDFLGTYAWQRSTATEREYQKLKKKEEDLL